MHGETVKFLSLINFNSCGLAKHKASRTTLWGGEVTIFWWNVCIITDL